MHIQDRSQKER